MLAQIKKYIARTQRQSLKPLPADEIAFLSGITSLEDLRSKAPAVLDNDRFTAIIWDAAVALGATKLQASILVGEADPNSEKTITLTYHDGEYLMGYEVFGEDAKLLEKIGLAKYVSGWGYYVNDDAVKALGTTFQYHQAIQFAKPALEAKKFAENSEKQRIANTFAEAKRTNRPVILDQYTDDCNDPREECSLDNITVYAMPNGTRKTTRTHTW